MGQSIPVHSSSRRTISAPPNAQEHYFISTNNSWIPSPEYSVLLRQRAVIKAVRCAVLGRLLLRTSCFCAFWLGYTRRNERRTRTQARQGGEAAGERVLCIIHRQIKSADNNNSWTRVLVLLVTTYMATAWIWTKSGGTQTRAIFLWLNYSKCNKVVRHWTGGGGGEEGAERGCIVTESIRVWRCEGESGVHVPLLRCRRGLRWV